MSKGELTRDELEKVALRLLSRRDATRQELRRALERRATRADDVPDQRQWIDEILSRCESQGYLSDGRYAAQRLKAMRSQGASARKIRASLRAKGVGDDIANALFDEEDEDAEASAARRLVERRRFGTDSAKFDKELASLARAGFGYDIARRAIKARSSNEGDE